MTEQKKTTGPLSTVNEQKKTNKHQSPRSEVFIQLAEYLRQRNDPPRKCCSFLDRPIVLTIIGTVVLGLVTAWWQIREDRRTLDQQIREDRRASILQHERRLLERKLDLLRTFPIIYQKSVNTVNNWLARVLWFAEELNKPKDERSDKDLTGWSNEIARLQEEYPKIEPIDGILAQIEALFESEDVRVSAAALRKQWLVFEQLINQTNTLFNKNETLTAKQIETAQNGRTINLEKVENLRNELIQRMGAELVSAT